MARKVDPALTKRAIGWVRRARAKASATDEGITGWEDDFLASVEERLERYGSAFADPDKGQLSAPLSLRQGLKLRQIGRKGTDPDQRGPRPGPGGRVGRSGNPAIGSAAGESPDTDRAGTGDPDGVASDPSGAPTAPKSPRAQLKRRKGLQSRGFARRKAAPVSD
jgi:hypothetical protein